ncbi:ABC transporter ATP-binding protein [Cohnella candidum]|uniref:ATP-binding cassette domain-containing protein n=1 Tax=Cohnella candidum TaxID=2674991 RepID=A0A3G3K2I4_9BACL|nr:ABC transporter ATP-binding protein [Cohnella candidum]AYQ74668.1 ATP-binding cassette domain-containing protein [Cohnella candidum]
MAIIELRDVTFHYPDASETALTGLSASIAEGEFVVLAGPSGSGKSTLLRLLKREVSPGGRLSGRILLDGRGVESWPAREAASAVGLVMQHPENQLVVDTVEHELAFGMENFGLDRGAMRRRMAEMAGFFGLEPLLHRRTDELSGGQKQLVNLAAVLMLQPRVLLLDEPLSQLDPLAARELLGMIKRLNDEWGITVIMSEHRIDDLLPVADRVIRLDKGAAAFDGTPRAFASEAWRRQDPSWIEALPAVTRWGLERNAAAGQEAEPPLSVKEARRLVSAEAGTTAGSPQAAAKENGPPLLRADGLFFAYDKKAPAVMRGLAWSIRRGDRVALFGGNGSGKSTLLRLLAGMLRPQRGDVRLEGTKLEKIPSASRYSRIGYLAQNPLLHFAHDTLEEDLTYAANRAQASDPAAEVRRMADRLGLRELLHRHPHDLSGGERQLGALGLALLGRPELLLLDEPTKGVDALAKSRLIGHLEEAHRDGVTLVMATHDVEFAAGYANRCSLLFQGEIVADDEPEAFFRGNLFYATPLHRLIQGREPRPAQEGAAFR